MSFQSRERFTIEQVRLATAVPAGEHVRLSFRMRLARKLSVWRERAAARRRLALMDARSLRDAGISPAAAAYEAQRPFWHELNVRR